MYNFEPNLVKNSNHLVVVVAVVAVIILNLQLLIVRVIYF